MVTPQRSPREAFDLAVRAVALFRAGADPVAVLAAIDQAETSLRRERDPRVVRPLLGVCRALAGRSTRSLPTDRRVLDRALRTAAAALGVVGDGATSPVGDGPVDFGA